jgi:hypothetical protein
MEDKINAVSKIKNALSFFLLLKSGWLTAQGYQQRTALLFNKITQTKIISFTYVNGTQKDSFVSATTFFNRLGYPLQQTIFKKDGQVHGRFVSEYIADSLEVREASFDSSGSTRSETFSTYDAKGQMTTRKSLLAFSGNKTYINVFEYENNGQLRKDFLQEGDKKTLMGIHEFDKNGELQKSSYHFRKGEPDNVSIYEYDSLHNERKRFSLKDGVKNLRSVKKYSIDDRLTEEIHYYDKNMTLSDGYGNVQIFKKGDVRKVIFEYDTNRLLLYQQETVNGIITLKLKFEYPK